MSQPGEGLFSVERREVDGVLHLRLAGVIDEFADLSFLDHLEGPVRVELREVRRINSFGVRLWIDGVRAISPKADVVFVEVPVVLVEQLNMIQGFFGRGRVESFLAPMVCNRCGRIETIRFDVQTCARADPVRLEAQCSACDAPMELDDIPEQYLAFLKDF